MSYDIYGNPLQRGHCEVHPYVHEEYPCSVCIAESSRNQQQDSCNGQCESSYFLGQCQEALEESKSRVQALQRRVEELEGALESIAEYWNRDCNMDAMLDALQHNVEIAAASLSTPSPTPKGPKS